MKKSIRTIALVSALTFAAAPSVFAAMTGTNPQPRPATPSFSVSDLAYTVLASFGL